MDQNQICPWCHTEIVWDEEVGKESECPHCLNELDDYRTLTVDLDDEESDDAIDHDDYEDQVHAYLEHQTEEESFACDQCQEIMLLVGEQRMQPGQFTPATFDGFAPVMPVNYAVGVHLCPSCFQVKYQLAEEDRLRVMHAIQAFGKVK